MNVSPTVGQIVSVAERLGGFRPHTLSAKIRLKRFAEWRSAVCVVAHECGYSPAHIGRVLKRDRTTIIHAIDVSRGAEKAAMIKAAFDTMPEDLRRCGFDSELPSPTVAQIACLAERLGKISPGGLRTSKWRHSLTSWRYAVCVVATRFKHPSAEVARVLARDQEWVSYAIKVSEESGRTRIAERLESEIDSGEWRKDSEMNALAAQYEAVVADDEVATIVQHGDCDEAGEAMPANTAEDVVTFWDTVPRHQAAQLYIKMNSRFVALLRRHHPEMEVTSTKD